VSGRVKGIEKWKIESRKLPLMLPLPPQIVMLLSRCRLYSIRHMNDKSSELELSGAEAASKQASKRQTLRVTAFVGQFDVLNCSKMPVAVSFY